MGAPAGVAPARGLVRIVELLRTCVPTKKAGPGAGAIPEAGEGLGVDTAKHPMIQNFLACTELASFKKHLAQYVLTAYLCKRLQGGALQRGCLTYCP